MRILLSVCFVFMLGFLFQEAGFSAYSYYRAEDLNRLWDQSCFSPDTGMTLNVEIREQISQTVEEIPYVRRLWDFYTENYEYDSLNQTITGNIIMSAERLLTGRSIEVDLNEKYSLIPKAKKPPIASKLSIGLKKVALNFKYDF